MSTGLATGRGELSKELDALVVETMRNLEWTRYSRERLNLQGARAFVTQFSLFTRHSRQCWAQVVANCPILRVRQFIVSENLYEEEANEETSHYNQIKVMGRALGLTDAEIDNAEPLPSTRLAFLVWECLTKNRNWLEGIAAKAVLERVNDPNCGNMSGDEAERWMRVLGLTRDQVKFWLTHDEADQVHSGVSYQFLEEYVRTPEDRERVLAAARDSLGAWGLLLDGIARLAVR